ncbi:NUDIX domain-containing protein [Streptomyces sp. NPDC001658]
MRKDTDFANPPGRRIGALALIRDESGAVLMVQKSYSGHWGLPGGCAHADEMPHVACAREVREETALGIIPERVLALDYMPRNEETGSAEGYNYVYDGGTVPNGVEITLPDAEPGEEPELIAYQFVPLYNLSEFAQPYTENRIRAAVAVLEDGRDTAFLCEGKPIAYTV